MNSLIAICVLISLSLAFADYRRRTRNDVLTYRQECVKELDLPADLVEKYKKLEYPNETKTQCYFKCVFSKWELFNNKTGFNVENIHQQLDAFHFTLAGCVDSNEQGSSACEWAYRGATCLLRENLAQIQESLAPRGRYGFSDSDRS